MTIDEIIAASLKEDVGNGDHTSLSTIPASASGRAKLLVKEDGILSGVDIARKVFEQVDAQIIFKPLLKDGDKIKVGDIVFTVEGPSISLLSAERLALNFLQRMSGIATATYKITSLLSDLPVKLLDTRKTTPLLRELEKYSVRMGGGHNHRFGLFDMILIKDNHVDYAGGPVQAIRAANAYLKQKQLDLKIEIEVRNFVELQQVLDEGKVHRIMLDNFSPDQLRKALQLIDGRYETEASGGINLQNIRQYAETGVDFISVGALTHQIKSLDLSLKAY
jgi:nicotinate-nucleotide pyrophosphorylase (carboxylating)